MQANSLDGQLAASRIETDQLLRLVDEDDLYERPLPLRHRLIFYLGHLEAFDWNQIGRHHLGAGHLDSQLDSLFERGIDPEPGQLPSDTRRDWPTLEQARSYVREARNRVDAVWRHASPAFQQTVIEHRWMHAETLAYLLHNLPHDKKRKPSSYLAIPESVPAPAESFVDIPAGTATLGRSPESGFGWDNEFGEVKVDVPAFAVSRFKVTNGEYLEFVRQGNPAPHFWISRSGEWFYRGMFDVIPLPLDAPVYVTQQQAAEYARWRGAELPTEAQYHRAAFGTPAGGERQKLWGESSLENSTLDSSALGNFDFRHWDPVSVTAYAGGNSAFGVAQLMSNGWEWTRTPFGPFPGFAPAPNYPGYSADFFDDKHFVLKGASPRTAALLTRRSLRNWFRPDYPYLYASFRLVHN